MNAPKLKRSAYLAVLSGLVLLFGCSSDSPTEPTARNNPSVPVSGGSTSTWTITLTATPDTIEIGSETTSVTLKVTARRNSDNAPPPQNATAVLTTTAGTLRSSLGTGSSVGVQFDFNREAEAVLSLAGQPAGDVVVRAQLEGSFGQKVVRILEVAEVQPMSVFFVNPGSGSPTGSSVTIHGIGFHEPVEVRFGNQVAVVQSVSSSTIRVNTPPVTLAAGTTLRVPVSVFSAVGTEEQQADTLAEGFVYARNGDITGPTIVSLTPTFGPNEGGTRVSIHGDGFASEVQVFFGTTSLIEAIVRDVSPTRVVIDTPSATGANAGNQNQIVPVRLVNLGSGASYTLPSAFQYGGEGPLISSAGPTEGLYLGGTIVTVFGTGFDDPVALEFGGSGQSVISVTGTEIVGRSVAITLLSCSNQTGPFAVTNIETGESTSSGISFTYFPIRPAISSLVPNEQIININSLAPVGGQPTSISIFGTGFDIPPSVLFDDINASGVAITAVDINGIGTTVTADIPRFTGAFATVPCGEGGTQLTPFLVDVEYVGGPGECSDVFRRGFSYVPSDTSCNEPTVPPPPPAPPTADFISIDDPGLSVRFIDQSIGALTYAWDFGDSGTSTIANPAHTYPAAADYTVTLIVSNSDGSDAVQKVITVLP